MRTIFTSVVLMGLASFAAMAAGDAKAGQPVYEKHCKTCHGPNGAAEPNVAKFQDGRITDLRSVKVQGKTDAEISTMVTKGVPGMRGDTTVSGKEMDDLIAYVRSLKP